MATKKSITVQDIITKYMDIVLTTGKQPPSVYQFAKSLKIDEQKFYEHFGSFTHIEKEIYALFFDNSLSLLEKSDDFQQYAPKEKVLSLYFTLIETFTVNRSYLILNLEYEKNSLQSLSKLSTLKNKFTSYISSLNIDKLDFKQEQLQKFQDKGYEEIFWIQLLVIIKFWIEDDSKGFEQTDIFIEKSVKAIFDVINTQPAKSIMDLGKFLLKEKMFFK